MSIKQIIVGTRNYTTQTRANEEPNEIQKERYNICRVCEFAISSTFFTVILDKHLPGIAGKKCRKCGCSLSLKIRSNSNCPINKWK